MPERASGRRRAVPGARRDATLGPESVLAIACLGARTIADLAGEEGIAAPHLAEALQ